MNGENKAILETDLRFPVRTSRPNLQRAIRSDSFCKQVTINGPARGILLRWIFLNLQVLLVFQQKPQPTGWHSCVDWNISPFLVAHSHSTLSMGQNSGTLGEHQSSWQMDVQPRQMWWKDVKSGCKCCLIPTCSPAGVRIRISIEHRMSISSYRSAIACHNLAWMAGIFTKFRWSTLVKGAMGRLPTLPQKKSLKQGWAAQGSPNFKHIPTLTCTPFFAGHIPSFPGKTTAKALQHNKKSAGPAAARGVSSDQRSASARALGRVKHRQP